MSVESWSSALQGAAEIKTLMQKLDIHETASLVHYAIRRGLNYKNSPPGFPLPRLQSFHSIQMDDSPACLFFLAHYAATSNREHPGLSILGGGSWAHGGNPSLYAVMALCPMRLAGQRKKPKLPPQ